MKKIKLLLVFTILITLLPMHVHASEVTIRDQIEEIVTEKINSIASKIYQSGSDTKAAATLALHGIKNRTTLKVGETHVLTSTIMNSESAKVLLIDVLTDVIKTSQQLSQTSLYATGVIDYYKDRADNYVYYYHTFLDEVFAPEQNKILNTCVKKQISSRNSYDDSLALIGGGVDHHITLLEKKTNKNTKNYKIDIKFSDKFDFDNASSSAKDTLLNGLGAILFREFNWEASLSFEIEVPYTCNHQTNNYFFKFDTNTKQINSLNNVSKIERSDDIYLNTSSVYYELNNTIYLKCSKPWILEFTTKLNDNLILSPTSNRNNIYLHLLYASSSHLFIRKFKEYDSTNGYVYYYGNGLYLDELLNNQNLYTFKFYNVIEKNNNKIYFTIYNEDTQNFVIKDEPFDTYYNKDANGTTIKQNSDFLNGEDIIISFIGARLYSFNPSVFEMKVYENGLNESVDTFVEKVTKQATCTEKGSMTRTCERCGYTYTESINPLGHSFSNYVDNKDGTSTSKCDHCDTIDTRVDVLLGDVNNDGQVTSLDRTILARHLAQWKGYETINELNADVNQDGKVTALDRTILARHLARWIGCEQLPYI